MASVISMPTLPGAMARFVLAACVAALVEPDGFSVLLGVIDVAGRLDDLASAALPDWRRIVAAGDVPAALSAAGLWGCGLAMIWPALTLAARGVARLGAAAMTTRLPRLTPVPRDPA